MEIGMAFFSATLLGVHPLPVEIEIDLSPGLPFFQIVGLPDAILRESKTRVKSAILQGGFSFPYDDRIVMNLAPSKVKKEGSGFELGLAARILASDKQIPMPERGNVLFLGELALDGAVKAVPEIEALSFAAHERFNQGRQIDFVVVPKNSLRDFSHLNQKVIAISHLQDLKGVDWWQGNQEESAPSQPSAVDVQEGVFDRLQFTPFWAKHFVIAATGNHHYFLCGPPGCGKTFFAEGLHLLLTDLLRNNQDVERKLLNAVFNREEFQIPWASPHHSASVPGLVGGGNPPRPGALTQAHGGVLFLDELLEFSPSSLDSLREPLEKGTIEIYRAGNHLKFPARFQLIAATNPCRCGHWKNPLRACLCPPRARLAYQGRMSGPFFDRFDVRIFCTPPLGNEASVSGGAIKKQIREALKIRASEDKVWSPLSLKQLHDGATRHRLNYRAQEKVKRLATTLCFAAGTSKITPQFIEEACEFQVFRGLEGPC
jgi:magnesium chelatase family protein